MAMEYTLDELVGAVASRLQAAGLHHQSNGQVSAFPDRRTLRYYTTIGLMDRPDTVRDRQAIYGDRHVSQAVAVKRLQASGLALAAIQHRLAGLPLPQVQAIAEGRAVDGAGDPAAAPGRRFWIEASAATQVPASPRYAPPTAATSGWWASGAPNPGPAGAGPAQPVVAAAVTSADTSVASPATTTPTAPPAIPPAGPADPSTAHRATGQADRTAYLDDGRVRPMLAIALTAGATLLFASELPLTPAAITDIRAAATKLVEHLEHLEHLSAADRTGADLDRKDHL